MKIILSLISLYWEYILSYKLIKKIMPTFDVISKINYQEFDNALANCLREISNRYDFKGLNISIERKDKTIGLSCGGA